jgi:hypothetical protein
MNNIEKVDILIKEQSGTERTAEPVTVGIPFPKGVLTDKKIVSFFDAKGDAIPLQTETLAVWPDKSIKWLLCDFMIDCLPNSNANYYMTLAGALSEQSLSKGPMRIENRDFFLTINTGKALVSLDKKIFHPFESVTVSGIELIDAKKSFVVLRDETKKKFIPEIKNIDIETKGLIRSTIKIEGQFVAGSGNVLCDFLSRLSFYAGKSYVKIDFTIKNPKAARHRGGLWDLGDEGSVYFDDLSFKIALTGNKDTLISYKTQLKQAERRIEGEKIEIYQDSSGGENWDSLNHINKYGKVMNRFRGYMVMSDNLLEEGFRTTPAVTVASKDNAVAATVQDFWQNFPKAIEAAENTLTLRLFPHQYNDLFELQGGEQKTHTVFLHFEANPKEPINLDWAHEPLVPEISSDWFVKTGVFKYLSNYDESKNSEMQTMLDTAVEGENTFFDRREIIDEYGWRNFGDLYADHEGEEAYKHKGDTPLISHYNNQYDVIYGTLRQHVKSGDRRWWNLSSELTNHFVDIDIYHTDKDRSAYNHGIFWHTDHFQDAATCTHRSFSIKQVKDRPKNKCGGGPGLAHLYTTGLLYQYYMTGKKLYKDALEELSQWVVAGINGPSNIKEFLKGAIKTGIKKLKRNDDYNYVYFLDGPGRASGNCVSSLMDFFMLTNNRSYLDKAEKLIKECVHPDENIDDRNLLNAEFRWMYTIFLQAVGKYLHIKAELEEYDDDFNYSKKVLLKYAQWMESYEYSFLKRPDLLEHPNYATRSAQDLRKADVLLLATEYADDNEMKDKFIQKARTIYEESLNSLLSLESRSLTRPLAILLQNADPLIYNNNLQDLINKK